MICKPVKNPNIICKPVKNPNTKTDFFKQIWLYQKCCYKNVFFLFVSVHIFIEKVLQKKFLWLPYQRKVINYNITITGIKDQGTILEDC